MKIFVDTNVLLDFLMRREPFYGVAARLMNRAESGEVDAYVSAISFNNIFYIARKTLGGRGARDLLLDLRRLCRIVPLDESVLDQAIALTVDDYEDAIQAVSAGRVGTPYLVTRDARDFEGTGLHAYSAEEVLVLLDSPSP